MTKGAKSRSLATRTYARRFVFLLSMLAAFLAAGVLQTPGLAQESVSLVGSGSSVPAPLFTVWAQAYNKRSPGIQMRYLPIGASEGIKEMSHGTGDFGAGEVPLTAAERTEGKLMEVPALVIAIVPIYNLPEIPQGLRLSGEVIAEIYLGDVKNWNDPQITKLNPGVTLPDLAIRVFNRPARQGIELRFFGVSFQGERKVQIKDRSEPLSDWPVGLAAERSSIWPIK